MPDINLSTDELRDIAIAYRIGAACDEAEAKKPLALMPDSDQRDWYMELAHKRAVIIVARHERAIRAVTAELLEHRQISVYTVRKVYEASLLAGISRTGNQG